MLLAKSGKRAFTYSSVDHFDGLSALEFAQFCSLFCSGFRTTKCRCFSGFVFFVTSPESAEDMMTLDVMSGNWESPPQAT